VEIYLPEFRIFRVNSSYLKLVPQVRGENRRPGMDDMERLGEKRQQYVYNQVFEP
jgi:hypothetical protein